MKEHSPLVLMIVVLASFIVPIVLHRLRWKALPVVVAEIIVGIVLGKSGFGLIEEDPWLTLLSTLGIIYLMFLSGLEIDFEALQDSKRKGGGKGKGGNPLAIAVVGFGAILVASYLISLGLQAMGYVQHPFFMTLIISTISLGVIMPVLKEKGIVETQLGQTILLTTVVGDFMTMILLSVYIALIASSGVGNMLLLLSIFAVFFVVWRLVRRLNVTKKIKKETISINTRGVFALILFFVVLAEGVGAENILGAFLAGVIVALLGPKKQFVHQLNAFGYGFLIPIFFMMVGAKLDLPALVTDPQALVMLPLLLVAFYLAKLVVIPILARHFSWRESVGTGLLLASKLSLVIAAAAIGREMNLLNATMETALVLSAVITTLVSPIVFQSFVKTAEKQERSRVSLVGINIVTLTLATDLLQDDYAVTVYGTDTSKLDPATGRPYPIVQIPEITPEQLTERDAFDCETLVVFTNDDEKNLRIAQAAEEAGVKQVIARTEEGAKGLEGLGEDSTIRPFSTIFSHKTLLKAMIEYPTMIRLMTHEGKLQEIELNNADYHERTVRELPFLGDTLIVRIFRGNETIIPHGDTQLQQGDRLIVTGSPTHVRNLQNILEY
ncbi:MAG TPA: monovalent cation:proton antiporter family protein [Bacilli bacterium]|nr:monovalent cation:proton antiporter family protein [Bacilli bacterium]